MSIAILLSLARLHTQPTPGYLPGDAILLGDSTITSVLVLSVACDISCNGKRLVCDRPRIIICVGMIYL